MIALLRARYPEIPPLYVTENGCSYATGPDEHGVVDDQARIDYLDAHLRAIADAMARTAPTYAATTAGRCSTTSSGPRATLQRFGLVHVDYATQRRTPKQSFHWYADTIRAQRSDQTRSERPDRRSSEPADLSALTEPTFAVGSRWVAWISLIQHRGVVGLLRSDPGAAGPAGGGAHARPQGGHALPGGRGGRGGLDGGEPAVRRLSDRTTLLIGRRLPWVVGGAVVGAVSMLVLAGAQSVVGLVLGWALAQVGAERDAGRDHRHRARPGAEPTARSGRRVARDRPDRRVIAGSGIAALTGSIAAGYLATAACWCCSRCPTAWTAVTSRCRRRTARCSGSGPFVRSFWISPRVHPDFAWAWITRFLMNLGNALVMLYLLYYLKDAVGLDDQEAEDGVFLLTAIYGVVTVVTAVLGGIWSDRVGRRKVFVIVSGTGRRRCAAAAGVRDHLGGRIVGAVDPRPRLRDLHRGRLRDDHRGAALGRATAPRTSA